MTKLAITVLIFLGACSDQVPDGEGWTFGTPKPDTSADLIGTDLGTLPDMQTDMPTFDLTADVQSKDTQDDTTSEDASVDFASQDFLLLSDVRYTPLPTGAIRYALSGFDPIDNVCVALIVEFADTFCFPGSNSTPASVHITENATDSNCWDYRGQTPFSNGSGCVEFEGDSIQNDIELTVESPTYKKTVRFF